MGQAKCTPSYQQNVCTQIPLGLKTDCGICGVCTGIWNFGPSGVRALSVAAGTNVGGHYCWRFFSLFLSKALTFLPERGQLGF